MNEKEAVLLDKRFITEEPTSRIDDNRYYFAKGYLEAIKKAKGLEKALQTCQAYRLAMNETGLKNIDKALAKWEKEK